MKNQKVAFAIKMKKKISPMGVTSPIVFDVKLWLSFKSILYDSKFLNCINVVINLRNCQAIHLHSLTGVIKHQSCKSTYCMYLAIKLENLKIFHYKHNHTACKEKISNVKNLKSQQQTSNTFFEKLIFQQPPTDSGSNNRQRWRNYPTSKAPRWRSYPIVRGEMVVPLALSVNLYL